jgi:hypothetical protein
MARTFLTSALDRGKWSASRPCRFNPGEIAPGNGWIGGWVCLRAGLDSVEKRKICTAEIEPGHSSNLKSNYYEKTLS